MRSFRSRGAASSTAASSVALLWGIGSLFYFLGRVLTGRELNYPSDVPEDAATDRAVEAANALPR